MCWNASVSLNTYIFGLFAILFSYFNGYTDILDSMFYHSIIIIQLIEYFIWSKTFSNRLLSQIAFLVILSQPVFNIILIKSRPEWIPYILVSYVMFVIILYTYIIPLNTIEFSSVPGENGHLSWKWLNINVFIWLIWYAFLSSRWIIDKKYSLLIIITIFLIASIILYKDTHTWGSMWCWICNIVSFIFIFGVFRKEICTI